MKTKTDARKRVLFNPALHDSAPFFISRNRLDKFFQCPRCFYADLRLGVKQPDSYPFTLNIAVDQLLKTEFDFYRSRQISHPLMQKFDIDAVPFAHSDLNRWRDNFTGMRVWHQPTNFFVSGALDDVWLVKNMGLTVADYKATSSKQDHGIASDYWVRYKRQVEVYQWLLERENPGFPVLKVAYFLLANGIKNVPMFNGRLEFDLEIIPYQVNTDWIEPALVRVKECLMSDTLPDASKDCAHCDYYVRRLAAEKKIVSS